MVQPSSHGGFESLAVSNAFDIEGKGRQNTLWTIWDLTPRVFEKEARDKAIKQQECELEHKSSTSKVSQQEAQSVGHGVENCAFLGAECSAVSSDVLRAMNEEIVLGYWDPKLYNSRILWPFICLFAASFGALHLISWNTIFPTRTEQWLWRTAALVTIVSMLVFIQFEKVVLRLGGPLTMISLVSPFLYLLSRLAMLGGVLAAFRASDPAIYETYTVSTCWVHIF